jgi:hypothetical protein
MTSEEAGDVILAIFRRECDKVGDTLTNKVVHQEYFRKTESGLGFFEGIQYLIQRKWLAIAEGAANTHQITKAGWRAAM